MGVVLVSGELGECKDKLISHDKKVSGDKLFTIGGFI